MNTGDIILIIAVVVSLVIGAVSILQTGRLQRRQQVHTEQMKNEERLQVLLGEIIDWATAVLDCGFGRDVVIDEELSSRDEGTRQRAKFVAYGNKLFRYQGLGLRSAYIMKMAEVFGNELGSAVAEVVSRIEAAQQSLSDHTRSNEKLEDKTLEAKCIATEHELKESVLTLVGLASDIKAKSISRTHNERPLRGLVQSSAANEMTLPDS